jgi:hypothetical protein
MDWFGDKNATETQSPVVDMTARQDRIRFAPLAQIEGYWDALRGTRMMPQRSEIDPRGLKGALEYCFVLERIAPGLARLRVAGAHLGDLMGMEVRGMPISSFLTSDARQEFGKALEEVFETPAKAIVTLTAETSFGRPPLKAKMILMPVRSDLGDTSRILGGFMTDGDIGRVPRRFNVDSIEIVPLTGRQVPAPSTVDKLRTDDFRPSHPVSRPAPQISEPAQSAPALAAEDAGSFEQAIPGVPYLRVVK